MSSEGLVTVIRRLVDEYSLRTPQRLKLVDAYLVYVMLTGIVQFVYCALVGTFPFNSFLSGFISCVGSFVLAGAFALGDYLGRTGLWCALIRVSPFTNALPCSMLAHADQPSEQEPVPEHLPRESLCRLYLCPRGAPPHRHQFHWLNKLSTLQFNDPSLSGL